MPMLIEDQMLRDEAGNIVGIRSTIQDMTRLKQAEKELMLAMVKLEQSNRELEQFAYVASHDLQEPLRGISGCVDLLARRYKGKLDASADEFIAHAVSGANRMRALISDLLAFSRVASRGKPFERTDCSEVLRRTLENLNVAIEESGAVVTHDELPEVMADPGQLTLLFQNLIGNAIKFRGDEPPRVHISTQLHPQSPVPQSPNSSIPESLNQCLFSVRDNGIGIDPQFAERIFVIFQRLHTRDWHWPRDLQEDRRTPRRTHLGRVRARQRYDVLVHDSIDD